MTSRLPAGIIHGQKGNTMYRFAFFETKEQAQAFRKDKGCGAIYSNTKNSRSKADYAVQRMMMQELNYLPDEFYEEHPFVVAWNQ